MSSRTKKPVKYPRKLRQTLEKVAAERDARALRIDPNTFDPYNTFSRSFAQKGSIALMHSRMDEKLLRLTTKFTILPSGVDRITVAPPWVPAEPDASS